MKNPQPRESPAPPDDGRNPGKDSASSRGGGRNREPTSGQSRRGLRALATLVPEITGAIFKNRGFAEAGILTDWPAIIGPRFANHCMPEKIVFPGGARSGGILHIRVDGPLATELQHLEPQIIERINVYFGYSAISRLRLIQGPLTAGGPSRPKPATAPDTKGNEGLREMLSGVSDAGLRAALEGLGRAVAGESAGENDGNGPKSGHKKT